MRHFLLLCITLLTCARSEAQTQPNFVFVIMDDMNDWVQGFNGHPQTATPNIQFLEKKGTTFTNAYASAPQCAPSRTSFITGKDCLYTQIYHNQQIKCGHFRLVNFNEFKGNETVFTIPEILKDSGGYYTYSINKVMHCHDNLADFDSLTADPCARSLSWSKAIVFDDSHGEEETVEVYGEEHESGVYEFPYAKIPDSLEPYMQDYLATDSAIDFIQRYADNPAAFCNKPFFLAVGYRRPHGPCYIPEHYFLPYEDTAYYQVPYPIPYDNPVGAPYSGVVMPPQPVPVWDDYNNLPENGVARSMIEQSPVHNGVFQWADFEQDDFGIPYIQAGLTDTERDLIMEESKRANMIMGYLAAIKFADAQLGRIIDELKTHPSIYNNTVFVVIGDHGYSLGEKTHWKKGCLWETDIRSALVIADMRSPVKKTCKRFVSFLDLFPTFCDLAGVDYPTFPDGSPYLDGFSLTPLLSNPNLIWNRPILTSFMNGKDPSDQGSCFVQYSVRDDEWHYIKYRTNGAAYPTGCDSLTSEVQEELYHIGKKKNIDPYEWDNLADDPAYDYIKDYLSSFMPGGDNYLQFEKAAEPEPLAAAEEPVLHMYPIPADKQVVVSLDDAAPGGAHLMIYSTTGNLVSELPFIVPEEGYAAFNLSVAALPVGYYVARIIQDNATVELPFSIVR